MTRDDNVARGYAADPFAQLPEWPRAPRATALEVALLLAASSAAVQHLPLRIVSVLVVVVSIGAGLRLLNTLDSTRRSVRYWVANLMIIGSTLSIVGLDCKVLIASFPSLGQWPIEQ